MRHRKFRLWSCLSYSQNSETAGGNVPFQITSIKIIVLTECNPSVLTADEFGKLKKAGVSQVKRNKATACVLPSIHLPLTREASVMAIFKGWCGKGGCGGRQCAASSSAFGVVLAILKIAKRRTAMCRFRFTGQHRCLHSQEFKSKYFIKIPNKSL